LEYRHHYGKISKGIIFDPYFLINIANAAPFVVATHGSIRSYGGLKTNLLKNADLLRTGLVGGVHDHRMLFLKHEKLDVLQ
jgi:hypothetical protein